MFYATKQAIILNSWPQILRHPCPLRQQNTGLIVIGFRIPLIGRHYESTI